jgi:hypothetical protein
MTLAAVSACEIPLGSLLATYLRGGSYVDCFVTDAAREISQTEYVEAFYTTALFKTERFILSWLVARPSTDREARDLACGKRDSFAAWHVEGRRENQLLLAAGRTRSWLMAQPGVSGTRLYFGSAVLRKGTASSGGGLGTGFGALLGFHKLYSRALLRAARARLEASS